MDDFLSVLGKGASGTGKGPVLLVAGLLIGLVGTMGLIQYTDYGQSLFSDTAAILPSLLIITLTTILPLVVTPYLLGGALGYAVRMASGGKPGWPEFFASARKHYLKLFFAGIVAYVIYMILGIAIVGVIFLGSAGSLIFCGLALPLVLIVFVCLMAIEFYDIIIVSENADFMRSFSASVGFVRKHFKIALPFFLIAVAARILVMVPMFMANELKIMAELLANYSYYFNETANATNLTSANMTQLAAEINTFSVPSLMGIAAIQVILQALVFAFLISYKAEFYRWAKSIKRITDFDYEFPDDKKAGQ
jgi:hypothetical protein